LLYANKETSSKALYNKIILLLNLVIPNPLIELKDPVSLLVVIELHSKSVEEVIRGCLVKIFAVLEAISSV